MTLHVSCAVEGSYVAHSAAMLHSALTQSSDLEVAIHYLHGPELPRRERDRLAGMVDGLGGSVSFVRVEDALTTGLPTRDFTLKATWYRLFLTELLPEVSRVLHLDVDTIVLDSLEPLWRTELAGNYVGAVTNVLERHHARRPQELGLTGPNAYFNAGVTLLDLELMRRDGCGEALRALAAERGRHLLWRDQDALNVVLGERRLALHPRWNLTNAIVLFPWSVDVFGRKALAEALREPAVRHFEGPDLNKPWHYLCDRPMRRAYFRHRRRTPWPLYRPAGMTPANFVRKQGRRLAHLRRRLAGAASPRDGG